MEKNFLYNLVKNPESRSIIKTIVWRILATVVTGVIIFLYTGKIKESGIITLTVAVCLTFFYYLHERFWSWIIKQKKSYFEK